MTSANWVHDHLPCGIEYGVVPLPHRHIVTFQIRILAGTCVEPADKLGLARIVAETIDKGTQQRTGRELCDAFDEIGASHGIGAGRETITVSCTVTPQHFERAVELHAEFLRTPTYPDDALAACLELAAQELVALEDDANSLVDKIIGQRGYGSILGRHPLGEAETLKRITRDDLVGFWQSNFAAGRMLVSVAGAVAPERAAEVFQRCFENYGSAQRGGRDAFPVHFTPGATHQTKDLEQQQIGICWPGVEATHDDFPIQQVVLGVLSGGMSGRLFTEIREKQGLVYWVSAWHETPRGAGMMFLGASTTPERCDKTYATLLREVDRLAEDIEPDELERAITGIVASHETRGDATRAQCGEMASDLFFFGHPIAEEEKIRQIQAVTIDDIRRYLNMHPRDSLCVVTLGPRPLNESPTGSERDQAEASA